MQGIEGTGDVHGGAQARGKAREVDHGAVGHLAARPLPQGAQDAEFEGVGAGKGLPDPFRRREEPDEGPGPVGGGGEERAGLGEETEGALDDSHVPLGDLEGNGLGIGVDGAVGGGQGAKSLPDGFHLRPLGVRVLDEELVGEAIRVGVQEHAVGWLPVTPGPPGLLVVGLEGARHRVVDDQAHVGLVDPHAKRARGDDGAERLVHEGVLHARALRVLEPRVIRLGLDLLAPQGVRHALDLAAGGRVHDGDARCHVAQRAGERVVLGRLVGGRPHAIGEVGAIKPGDDDGGVAQSELDDDVLADLGGGRGREGVRGRRADRVADGLDAPVARAEVVPPLADAVGFVDGEEADADAGEAVGGSSAFEPFRGEVEEPNFAALDVRPACVHLVGREGAVEIGGGDPTAMQRVHLILHQGDER